MRLNKSLNKALKRARYPTKTIDDIIDHVSGACLFSKLDLAKAFYQLELAEESRPPTTIVTHQGLYRYRRLHMISSASEIFTETIRAILAGCRGVLKDARAAWAHAQRRQVLLYQEEVTFFGLRFNKDGVSPTDRVDQGGTRARSPLPPIRPLDTYDKILLPLAFSSNATSSVLKKTYITTLLFKQIKNPLLCQIFVNEKRCTRPS